MDKLNIVHIGGRGGVGLSGRLYPLGPMLDVTVIEADMTGGKWGTFEQIQTKQSQQYGFPVNILQGCISDKEESASFKLKHDIRASSLFDVDPNAVDYCKWTSTRVPRIFPWGEACRTTSTVQMETVTLDTLYSRGMIPIPSVLSMDIQGAEGNAAVGARNVLCNDGALAVLSESQFRPLYKGQKTFGDLNSILLDYGFFLADFIKIDTWWEGIITDRGFPALTECLFLKNHRLVSSFDDLIKLAAIAYIFDHAYYGYIASSKAISVDMDRWIGEKNIMISIVRREHDRMTPKIAQFNKLVAIGKANP